MQGLGGGGLISLAQTIIADVVAPKERGRYQGYIAGVFVTSSVAGPVLGGFFAEHLHWSMIFWINLPLGLLAFWMTNSVLRRLPRHERPHRLDVLGAVLMVLATVLLLLALSWGGTRYPWSRAPVLGLLAGSAVVLGACSCSASRTARRAAAAAGGRAQPGGRRRHRHRLLGHGRVHRPLDLRADLPAVGAGPVGQRLGHRADRADGRHGDRRHDLPAG